MGFASRWLDRSGLFPAFIQDEPARSTGIIIVVPCYNEPSITALLDSLSACDQPFCDSEVIIVVNAPSDAPPETRENNLATLAEIDGWKRAHNPFFRLYSIYVENPPVKDWGVGLARKCGMDEALRRFSNIDNPDGVIVCLDADCSVSRNYFRSLEEEFLIKRRGNACSVYFEHPLDGSDYPHEIYSYIIQYELHLRYFLLSLRYTGFPYPFHTVGSSLAVKASAYMKAGGMNRRQAGEDFYFVQKLVPSGGYFALTSAVVCPSPRKSGRVPFGTGAAITRMADNQKEPFLTYNPDSFTDLRNFFSHSSRILAISTPSPELLYSLIPGSLKSFLDEEEFINKLEEIVSNTSAPAAAVKRFFQWFNMFRIIKYLNYSHVSHYKKVSVAGAAARMLELSGFKSSGLSETDLLLLLRKIEREI